MKKLFFLCVFICFAVVVIAGPAPDFTVTNSQGQTMKLYQDFISQQKLVVIEAFFTTCPPCNTHAPHFQNLYVAMQAAYPGQVEFIMLSTLFTDTNVKVQQYRDSKGLTMPGAGNDGGSIAALQPYTSGQFGQFQGTPTFIVIEPGTGEVHFDIRGNSATQTMVLLQQKIESLLVKNCTVTTAFGQALEEVVLHIEGPDFSNFMNVSGTYSLSNVPACQNTSYVVRPTKADNPLNGLTTYDLVLISKHILGIEPLMCDWQLTAADINCNGSITTFDIVTGRRVILGIDPELPCGPWRFKPDSALLSNGNCQSFTGVKLGDVNADTCHQTRSSESRAKQPEQLHLHFRDHHLAPGERASVDFWSTENVQLEGFQLAFSNRLDMLKINDLGSSVLAGFDDQSFHLSAKRLAISWMQAQGQDVRAGEPWFSLDVEMPAGGRLSDVLYLSEVGFEQEAYQTGIGNRTVILSAQPATTPINIAPNPNSGHFTLEMSASEVGTVPLQLTDVQGRILIQRYLQAEKGINRWEIRTDLAPGLYFLQISGHALEKVIINP